MARFLNSLWKLFSNKGLFFLLFLCRPGNLIIQWASENLLIEICYVFNIIQVMGPAK